MHNILESHHVGVLELFEKRNLPDGGGGHSFLLLLEPDLFQGDRRARRPVAGLVDDSISPLADLLDFLVLRFECFVLGGGGKSVRERE
jgi:hypothetical protein